VIPTKKKITLYKGLSIDIKSNSNENSVAIIAMNLKTNFSIAASDVKNACRNLIPVKHWLEAHAILKTGQHAPLPIKEFCY
jgi:hypothetical protein